jgi:hypothetical protein
MAQLCRGQSRQITLLQILLMALSLVILSGLCVKAQTLYERPVLIVDPEMHIAVAKTAPADPQVFCIRMSVSMETPNAF